MSGIAGDIEQWLDGLGLGKYADVFAENEVDLAALPHLTEDDLKELGLPLGPRKIVAAAIAAFAEQGAEASAKRADEPAVQRHDAERRQLTVFFCDLVGSTMLSTRLDPEDLRDVMRQYQAAVAGVINDYSGYVANYLGDGVVAYFGWPTAHEDQAAQAVRAGLAAVEAVGRIALPGRSGEVLAARVGIATGQVVVGDLQDDPSGQQAAVAGETPNLAARLQGLAAPGEVIISDTTRQLLTATFFLEDLGAKTVKGIAEPISVWRVAGERSAESRFEARGRQLTSFIGRNHEVGLLLDRWQQAAAGEGQVVLISGEPGIGKSRTVQTFRERIDAEAQTRLRYQCSPYHLNSALYPVIQQLGHAAGFEDGEPVDHKLDKLEVLLRQSSTDIGGTVPLIAALLSLPCQERYGALDVGPQQQRTATLRALRAQLIGLARQGPILFVVEDAHWIDPTTPELVADLVPRIVDQPVLMLITHRPEWSSSFQGQSHVTTLNLTRLSRSQVAAMVRELASSSLNDEVVSRIANRTDGVPLFVEELTKALAEAGFEVDDADIPATLQASLMARLDRLGSAKEIAQIGAAIGREFDDDLLRAVADKAANDVDAALERLVRAQLVFRTGTTLGTSYTFKHALVQDVAYDSLLRSRRRQLHLRIAQAIEQLVPDIGSTQPELLAYHFQEGGDSEAAICRWTTAGELAESRSAAREAAAHFRNALALLGAAGDDQNEQSRELQLSLKFGNALEQAFGYASKEAGEVLDRALRIASSRGDVGGVILSLAPVLLARGRYRDIVELPGHGNGVVPTLGRDVAGVHLGLMLSVAHFLLGQFDLAWRFCEAAIALDDKVKCSLKNPIAGADPAINLRSYGSWIRHRQGYAEQSDALVRQALEIAGNYEHAYSQIWARLSLIRALFFRARYQEVAQLATELKQSAEERGFSARIGNALIYRGHARALLGEVDHGLTELRTGLKMWEAHGGISHVGEWTTQAAETALIVGRLDDAKGFLARAESVMRETDELAAASGTIRLNGRLLKLSGEPDDAETKFLEALQLAQKQGAMVLALRAATDAAEVMAEDNRRETAAATLRPVYDWFTEGFDIPELVRAKELLTEVA